MAWNLNIYYFMINTININLSGLNLNNYSNPNLSETKLEIEGFLKELFKMLLENQKNPDSGNIIFTPFLPFSMLTSQDIANLDKFFENMKIQKEGLYSLYELLKSGQVELNDVLESLKLASKDNQNFSATDNSTENVLINLEKNNIKEIFKIITSQKNKNSLEMSSSISNKEIEKITETSDSIKNNLISIESLKNEKVTIDENQIIKHQKINSENLSSQLNLNSTETLQYNNIQQKAELPLTKLNEIPDIIFKALSTSQKTLIVHLEPPELGKILIKLSMDSSGVRADMKVDYPHVKEMLTNLIPEIKNNLQSSGVKISDFLLDLTRDQKGYSDSSYGQGQRKNKNNQKFYEYFA